MKQASSHFSRSSERQKRQNKLREPQPRPPSALRDRLGSRHDRRADLEISQAHYRLSSSLDEHVSQQLFPKMV
jgi:hypothetical protein